MDHVNSNDVRKSGIRAHGNDMFNDDNEIEAFERYIHIVSGEYNLKVRRKPFGKTAVDIGLYFNGELLCPVDVEMHYGWKDDWPSNWNRVHFIERKYKLLENHGNSLIMVYFNYYRNKFIMTSGKDWLTVEPVSKYVKRLQKWDMFRELPLNKSLLIGSNLTERESELFTRKVICKF